MNDHTTPDRVDGREDVRDDDRLPDLTESRIAEIEAALLRSIHTEGAARRDTARRRRTRVWGGLGAAASVVVAAVVLGPAMPALLGTAGSSDGSTAVQSAPENDGAPEILPGHAVDGVEDSGAELDGGTPDMSGSTTVDRAAREIIATASTTLRVDDVGAAATRIGEIADATGGYVEAMSVGGAPSSAVPGDDGAYGTDVEIWPEPSGAWITIRVPADTLTDTSAAVAELGEVTASRVDRRDVTAEAVDLRARVDALQASVDRLTALLGEADSTADLIAAEDALASRQSDLESLQQQLEYLEDQVGMSTLTVTLLEPDEPVVADPAGFGDGVAAGWNGLLATLNGFVLAVGFLLPWLGVAAAAALVVWLIRRALRRRRARRTQDADADADADAD